MPDAMMMLRLASSFLLLHAASGAVPRHVRLNFCGDPTTCVVVSWAANTSDDSTGSACYAPAGTGGTGGTCIDAAASDNSYANAWGLTKTFSIALPGLMNSTTYSYNVSVGRDVSPTYSFTTLPDLASNPTAEPPIVLYWADLGRDGGGQAFPALEAEALLTAARASGSASVGIQAGDFAYDLGDHHGARGSDFMDRFSNISKLLPTHTTIGNHELPKDLPLDVNASHYVNCLGASQPGGNNGSYYSVDVGLMHLVFLSSEVLALGPYGGVTVAGQQAWLEADLRAMDRVRTPWAIAVAHRPMYCSNDNSWCGANAWQANPVRLAWEGLFIRFGVDVFIAGHEHSVELTYPTINGTATAFDYENPTAPVHIVSGVAGCNENKGECVNPMGPPAGNWSAARLAGDPIQYGYSRFWAPNASSFHFEQVQTNVGPEPVVWRALDVSQERHGPFSGLKR